MIGLALSGGGSRAMAFHLGCLRALHDLGLLERIGVLSTISGGSVIGAYYAYTPQKSFAEFDADVCGFLRNGFQFAILKELLKPRNLLSCGTNLMVTKLEGILCKVSGNSPTVERFPSRSDMFRCVLQRDLFPSLRMDSPRRNDIDIVIGACELRKGIAFRFGNSKSGDWRHGELVDGNVEVGFATAASAAYPIILPAFDRTLKFRKGGEDVEHRVLLTDGGVYDNLGIQVLEPGRDPQVSLHTYPCEYLIVCNAGQGLDVGTNVPIGFLPRVARSFEVVHRRVQDGAMHRLHHLKQAGLIKGFAMPYLGQQDEMLPTKTADFVERSEVVGYPTNFAPMSEKNLHRLVARGEQLTRLQVEFHIPEVL